MSKDFSLIMSKQDNKQLVDIVTTKRDEYEPEAVIAAEKELEKRQINPDTFIHSETPAKEDTPPDIYREDLPLNKVQIAFIILLPVIFITFWALLVNALKIQNTIGKFGFTAIVLFYFIIHKWLKDNGYQKRAKEFLTWTTYSVFIYLGLLLIAGLAIYFFS